MEDEFGANSSVAKVEIALLTPLVTKAATGSHEAFECVPKSFSIVGRDYSPSNSALRVQIVQPPSHGILRDPANGHELRIGDLLNANISWPQVPSIEVQYTSFPGYFSSPATDWEGLPLLNHEEEGDAFTFRVVGAGGGFVSQKGSITVQVVNVNDPSVLEGPDANPGIEISVDDVVAEVYASRSLSFFVDDDGNDTVDEDGQNTMKAVIKGVKLQDTGLDFDVDVVKVPSRENK